MTRLSYWNMESGAVTMVNSKARKKTVIGAIISKQLSNDFKAPAAIFKPPAS